MYELKYAFLYGYNGTTFAIPGTSVGVHTGDLEHVTIRVDARRMMWVLSYRRDRSWLVGKDIDAQPGVKMTTRVHQQEDHEGLTSSPSVWMISVLTVEEIRIPTKIDHAPPSVLRVVQRCDRLFSCPHLSMTRNPESCIYMDSLTPIRYNDYLLLPLFFRSSLLM